MDNITDETVALLTNQEVLLVNQNATAPPRPILQQQYSYQGLGYTMLPCNESDTKQQWNTSALALSADGSAGVGVDAGDGGGGGGAPVSLHKTYSKNGTLQEVCMRLMVMHSDCSNMNYTSMDLMDCSVSHCGRKSIEWNLPSANPVATQSGGNARSDVDGIRSISSSSSGSSSSSTVISSRSRAGPITNALTAHCLSADTNGKITTAVCTDGGSSAGQVWKVTPAADGRGGGGSSSSMVTIQDASSNLCLTESVPTPAASAYVWVAEAGGRHFVGLFNADDWEKTMSTTFAEIGLPATVCAGRDIWKNADLGTIQKVVSATVQQHDVAFIELSGCR